MDDVLGKIRDCRTDIAVRAGAGAGKTTALVEKYMAELLTPRDEGYYGVDRIAAITFTEKAAAEMSGRVRQKLTEKIEQLRQETRAAGSSANLLVERSEWSQQRRLLNHLVRQRQMIKSAYISTIHAFCARLLWENPLAAGVDPGFSVMSEVDSRATLETCAVETILIRLRRADSATIRLARDHGFRGLGRGQGLVDRVMWIIPLLRAANMTPKKLEWLHTQNLDRLREEIPANAETRLRQLCQTFLDLSQRGIEYKFAQSLIEIKSRFGAGEDIDAASAGRALEQADKLEKGVLGRKTYLEGKNDFAESLEAALLAKMVYGVVVETAAADEVKAFADLLQDVMASYARSKESRSLLDYNDLQEKARDLLVNSKPTLDEYRARLARVLIDEFQDTDKLQAYIINLLAPPGEGRLFFVGDLKQSIYSFRGADPGVFVEQSSQVVQDGGEEYFLVESRRATPMLTEFFNVFFSRLMSDGKGGEGGGFHPKKDRLVAVRDGKGVDSAVCRIAIEAEGIDQARVLEARAVAQEMRRLVEEQVMVAGAQGQTRPVKFSDMALLLRSFSKHEIYETAMRRAGVPFQVVKGRGFYDCQEIKDLANMLFHIGRPADKLAMVSVLRSPLVGLKDETILRLFYDEEGDPIKNPLPMKMERIPETIEEVERERLGEFVRMSARWRRMWDRVGVSELLEMILDDTGYGAVMMSRQNGERILANIFKLIELARTFEKDWSQGFVNFTARLDNMISTQMDEAKADIAAGEEDVALMMTVHQSKGLEFPVVFLGDVGFGKIHQGGHMVFSPKAGLGVKVHDLVSGSWRAGPVYDEVRRTLNEDRQEEMKRLLYVAMTRARDRLILSGPAGKNGGGEWVKWINRICDEEKLVLEAPPQPLTDIEISSGKPEDSPLVQSILQGSGPVARERIERTPPPPERAQLRVSVTALADFHKCSRMYYQQSMGDTREISSGMSTGGGEADTVALGSLVHRALETAPLGMGNTSDGLADTVRHTLLGQEEKVVASTLRNILGVFQAAPLDGLKLVDPGAIMREVPLAMKIEGEEMDLVVHGASDIIWFDGQKWNMVDYKHTLRPKDEGRHLFQVRLYALALMEARKAERMEVAVVYLKEKRNPATCWTIPREDLEAIRDEALQVAGELHRMEGKPMEEWKKQDTEFCRRVECRFMKTCWENQAS